MCNNCNKKGNFKAVCKSKVVHEVFEHERLNSSDEDVSFLGAVHNTVADKLWSVDVFLDNTKVNFKIDTGADVDIISDKICRRLMTRQFYLQVNYSRVQMESPFQYLGYIKCSMTKTDKTIQSNIYVKRGRMPLLGRKSSVALGVVALVDNVQSHPQLFKGLETPYKIELQFNAELYAVQYPRRVAVPLLPKVKKELDRLETLRVIKRVMELTEWHAPIVVVPKANDKVRICVDYTHLNQAVKRERHLLPTVEQVLAQMSGATVFSKLDANCGFHQIKLTKDSKPLTTFVTPYGRYSYNRLPFGINSGPEHFQMQIHRVLEDQPGVTCIMDDMVVYGKDLKQLDERLSQVLDRLSKAKITLNEEKCEFRKSEISCLGQIVGRNGIKLDPDKVYTVVNITVPLNVSDLCRFLGIVNQLGKFLPNLATVTEPLRDLLSAQSNWY